MLANNTCYSWCNCWINYIPEPIKKPQAVTMNMKVMLIDLKSYQSMNVIKSYLKDMNNF